MAEPTDDEIAAWADGFIKQHAFNRAVAVQIATEAAKWVRGRRVQVGWYHESPATGTSGLRSMWASLSELAEWRRLGYLYPVYRTEREAVPEAGALGVALPAAGWVEAGLVCQACAGDAPRGKCLNPRCIGGPIVRELVPDGVWACDETQGEKQ